jgi:hypothetical protein
MTRLRNLFISYNHADERWAEWIAWTVADAGYTHYFQKWDFRPGGNFVLDMQNAAAESERTLLYVPALRLMGAVLLLAGLLLFIGSLLAAFG